MIRRCCLAAAIAVAISFDAAASCGAAFCLVDTDWAAQGAWTGTGLRFDLRYESIELDQPRSGRERLAVGQIPRHHDEVLSRNRNWVAGLDWSPSPEWGVSVTVPYVDRHHEHIHNHRGAQLPESWDFHELGDVRVLARHEIGAQRDSPTTLATWGLLLGAKLPTGKHDIVNGEGAAAERTLQPGSGTTDAIVGAYWNGVAPMSDLSWFARVLGIIAVREKDGYKPGRQIQLDGGVRYALARDVSLSLQANFIHRGRDSGAEAEPDDSGQRQLWISPGVSWNVARNVQAFAFVQFPIYQSVNGVQLTADRAFTAGVSWRF
jgi:hypothetical protein